MEREFELPIYYLTKVMHNIHLRKIKQPLFLSPHIFLTITVLTIILTVYNITPRSHKQSEGSAYALPSLCL